MSDISGYRNLLVERRGAVGIITLNRPEVRNAVDKPLADAMAAALDKLDADETLSLGVIAGEARALAERVREGKITPPELSGGTFTVSNLGMFGIRRFVAVINPPQAAILAVGELTPRPVVRDGEIVVRAIMEITLTCDHRILYGADAAQFLGTIREYLESPLRLVL